MRINEGGAGRYEGFEGCGGSVIIRIIRYF